MTAPDIDNITGADLRDDERLGLLYLEAVRRKFTNNTAPAVLDFWCWAEKALHDDKHGSPGKLFYSLLKAKDTSRITDGMEQTALSRMTSDRRQELVDYTGGGAGHMFTAEHEQETFFGRNVTFTHGILAQCFLPHRKLNAETVTREGVTFEQPQSRYTQSHGKASLVVRAGEITNPDTPNDMIAQHVPFGTNARLILPYICGTAISNNSRVIDLGSSLRRYMKMIGLEVGGYRGSDIHDQIRYIAAAQFFMGDWRQPRKAETNISCVAKRYTFWLEKDEYQQALWTPEMELSQDFFDVLKEHRVPLDMNHLVKCRTSPRLMDHYVWMSYRLPLVKKKEGVPVPISDMHRIFGQTIKSKDAYLRALRKDLKIISSLWPHARFKIDKWIFWIYPSKPVLPRSVVQAIGLNNKR